MCCRDFNNSVVEVFPALLDCNDIKEEVRKNLTFLHNNQETGDEINCSRHHNQRVSDPVS